MTQFIYTHHQGGEGKMVEKPESLIDTVFDAAEFLSSRTTYPALGFSPSDNGKTFGEDQFEVKKQVYVFTNEWKNASDEMYNRAGKDYRRIIAVPLSEKREERMDDADVVAMEQLYDVFTNWYHDDGSYDNFLRSEAFKAIKAYAATNTREERTQDE